MPETAAKLDALMQAIIPIKARVQSLEDKLVTVKANAHTARKDVIALRAKVRDLTAIPRG